MHRQRGTRFLQLLLIFYFLEAGTFLIVSPWNRYWLERVVARSPERFQAGLNSPYFRGLIAGLGALHIVFALAELAVWREEAKRR